METALHSDGLMRDLSLSLVYRCMRVSLRKITAVVVLFILWAPAVLAQDVLQLDNHVVNSQLSFQTIRANNQRLDTQHGVARAQYRIDSFPSFATPQAAGEAFLTESTLQFGWLADASDLELVESKTSLAGAHLLYRQVFKDLPVYGRHVKINVSRNNTPTMVLSSYDPGVQRRLYLLDEADNVTRAEIPAIIGTVNGMNDPSIHQGDKVWFLEDDTMVKVWRVVASSIETPGEFEFIVHAGSGAILHVLSHSFKRHGEQLESEEVLADPANVKVKSPSTSQLKEQSSKTASVVDGTGLVFDPDPLSTSGSSYTPPFVDNGDSDIPELNAQRVSVTLQDISQVSGSYVLEGPHIKIVGGGSLDYNPPAESSPNNFQYTRAATHFEAVNAYYHIDKSQRYVQSLGFDDVANSPLSVNPHAFGSDNSVYSPGQNLIQFGLGGVDDAEDAGVLWHEYGHALLESSAPSLVATSEGQALHEGWSDYWAGSYLRFQVAEGVSLRTDWREVFKWDSGDGTIWAGRTIESNGTYPDDTRCEDAGDSNGDGCDIYDDGTIWAATLMEIFDELDRTVTDQLNLQSHMYLMSPATFVDAAEALIQADIDLFDGLHTAVLINILGNRGYINESSYGPVITHEELSATEQLGGSRTISATVSTSSAAVDSVFVWYGQGDPDQRLILSNVGGNTYQAELPLPTSPGSVQYYLEAVDDSRQRSVLPGDAPVEVFSFDVGPDMEAPEIIHSPITSASLVLWPPRLVATITDNLGVSSVEVFYEVRDQVGVLVENDSFNLMSTTDDYSGDFPIAESSVAPGYSVGYRIVATDASNAANETMLPQSGLFTFVVTNQGSLVSFDFEDGSANVDASGEWQRGRPAYGLAIAHSGNNVWGTSLETTYSAVTSRSTLDLPELNLANVSTAYLIFWHWYDVEYEGTVSPHEVSNDAEIWDGGNIKISTDGGSNWVAMTPQSGYTGEVSNGSNPLAGEQVFGGYSFGWRREIVALPTGGPVQVRFDFGTDASNTEETEFFAGWYIDDVNVTTELPVDNQAPVVVTPPQALTPVSANSTIDPVEIVLSDNTGINRAEFIVRSSVSTASAGDVLLAMNPADSTLYSGAFTTTSDPLPGDRINYIVEVEDFDGNVTVLDNGGAGYVLEFRTFLSANLLLDPVATGLWRRDGENWIADGDGTDVPRSALIMTPVTLPENTDVVSVELRHRYNLLPGAGGNVKITQDDGGSWQILEPVGGYPGSLDAEGHPMDGEPVFEGNVPGIQEVRFGLEEYAGKEIRLKLDLGASRPLAFGESWEVTGFTVEATTRDTDAVIPLEVSIGANFPEPFSTTTNITYAIEETGLAKLSIYDVLGRRVRLLAYYEHEPGNYSLQISATGLAAGMYYVVLEASGKLESEPITVIH